MRQSHMSERAENTTRLIEHISEVNIYTHLCVIPLRNQTSQLFTSQNPIKIKINSTQIFPTYNANQTIYNLDPGKTLRWPILNDRFGHSPNGHLWHDCRPVWKEWTATMLCNAFVATNHHHIKHDVVERQFTINHHIDDHCDDKRQRDERRQRSNVGQRRQSFVK